MEKHKKSYNNNKLKISAPRQNDEFDLPDGSNSVSNNQDYFEYILEKYWENIDNPSIRIYVNNIENRITLKIKTGCYLEILAPETMKLLGNTENKITKDKNGENVPHLMITEKVLVHFNTVNNNYQQDSRVLYTFVPNKPFSNFLEISRKSHISLKTFNSEIRVWLTNQDSQPLEIEDKINLTLIIS